MAENGDIANWARSPNEPVKQVGGAMDLAIGAKRLWVAMEHNHQGAWRESRIRRMCSYPLTAKGVVKRVYTDLAVLEVTPAWICLVIDMIAGPDARGFTGTQRSGVALVMITGIEIKSRSPLVGGAAFGDTGAYERIDGVAIGVLDPAHPRNRGIALLEQAPRNTDGLVAYRSDFVLLRPVDAAKGNGRLLYEVNNRGRIMLFANLCAGAMGNQPKTADDLGNALPLRLGFSLLWTGWDAGAPKATGLSLDVPVIEGVTQPIREEFVSGTRLGVHEAFKLAYEAVGSATVTVRRTQTAARVAVASEMVDRRTVRPLAAIETGSIYEVRYQATKPRVLGIGFAATRDIVSYLREQGADLLGRPVEHTLAFGISQAGRYLRDLIALGFNGDEDGRRVFDGVFTHVAGIGRVFFNTPFGQPFRTRTCA